MCNKDKEKDKRIRNGQGNPTKEPENFCTETFSSGELEEERAVLHDTYHSAVSELAESLCDDDPDRELARKHADKIIHLRSSLVDWLGFLGRVKTPSLQQILAVVLKPKQNETISFEETVTRALKSIVQQEYPANVSKGFILPAKEHESRVHGINLPTRHSSNVDSRPKPPKMSALGECCVARHLSEDYQLLKAIVGEDENYKNTSYRSRFLSKACHWGNTEDMARCIAAIQSMIHRRAAFVEDTSQSCSAIVNRK